MASKKLFRFSLAIGLTILSILPHPIAHSAELDEIKRRGKLIVAVKDNLRPLGYLETNGQLQGFEIDIARRLATELLGDSKAVVLQPVANNQRLNVVLEEEVDLTIARVTATDSRSRLVYLSIPYYLDGTGLITKDASTTKLKDFQFKKIAVLNGSSTIAVVQYNLPESQLVGVNSYQEALQLLEKGSADAFAADKSLLTGWVQEYPEYKMLPVRLSSEALCVVMPKGIQYSQLQRRVNEAIARWKVEGWLAESATAWGLP